MNSFPLLLLSFFWASLSIGHPSSGRRCRLPDAAEEVRATAEAAVERGDAATAKQCLHLLLQRRQGSSSMGSNFWWLLGQAHELEGEIRDALLAYGEALLLPQAVASPDLKLQLHSRRALLLQRVGLAREAAEEYRNAISGSNSTSIDLWYEAGHAHLHGGSLGIAARLFKTGFRLSQDCTPCVEGMATALYGTGHVLESLNHFRFVAMKEPSKPLSRSNLAAALGKIAMDVDERFLARAQQAYLTLMGQSQRNGDAMSKLLMLSGQLCSWTVVEQYFDTLRAIIREQIADGEKPALSPFNSLLLPLDAMEVKEIHRAHARHQNLTVTFPNDWSLLPSPSTILRVGFVSADIRDHPVGRDLKVILKALRSRRVETYLYALNPLHRPSAPDRDKQWTSSIIGECFKTVELSSQSSREASSSIAADGIHVLVDLMGYTRGNQISLFSFRPSPLLLAFKGYMSTTGLDYFTLVTDITASPPELRSVYTERFAYIPGSFFISGHKINHKNVLDNSGSKAPKREEQEQPGEDRLLGQGQIHEIIHQDRLLLCSFNSLYKITRHNWRTWMQILAVTRSEANKTRLWLLKDPAPAIENLCKEAEEFGLNCSRDMLFTTHVSFEVHLQVKSRCNLSLDTFQYNSHGTAADILWAGVPLVTLPNITMASRVAASILRGSSYEELVARNVADYVDIAHRLATTPRLLANLRASIQKSRTVWALHDHETWASRFSALCWLMWDLFDAAQDAVSPHVVLASSPHPSPPSCP